MQEGSAQIRMKKRHMANRKDKQHIDPHAAREAEKYGTPIPSREFILDFLEQAGQPLSHSHLQREFDLTSEDLQIALKRRLRAMERDGQLVMNRKGRFGIPEKMQLLPGRVVGHRDGFGFVVPDEGGDDLFLTPNEMRSVFHGDRVLARVTSIDARGRLSGNIAEVLERNTDKIVGRYFLESGVGFVVSDNQRINQDILIPADKAGDAKPGQIVVAAITMQPTRRFEARGEIIKVLGDHMAPGMEIEVAIYGHGLPFTWSEAIKEDVTRYTREIDPEDIAGRIDLRDLPLVTIDGEDAKDFDDAVYCEPREKGGWRLFVAIADVSHYVTPKTALDKEAFTRGNSVYFPGHVVPMLPEILSNGLCSLNPNVDRLSMVCEMVISPDGEMVRSKFYDAVIRSHARLTYTDVAKVLIDKDKYLSNRYAELLPQLMA